MSINADFTAAYLRSGIWLAAKGQAEIDAAQQSLPRLKLIGPLNRHQLILANLTEPGTYYLHELTTDRYYRYELIDDARSKRSRRAASRRSVRSSGGTIQGKRNANGSITGDPIAGDSSAGCGTRRSPRRRSFLPAGSGTAAGGGEGYYKRSQ